ncbi:MAG TPA: substrate-binding protein [Vicinamibacterales bacterium]|nr:substrate-binding protein [Vicinamibacterales bacterium]
MNIGNTTSQGGAVKVGVIMDETGPLAPLGTAAANTARMVVEEINAAGGLLGRSIALIVEDSETNDGVAAAKAEKLVRDDRVAVVLGGIYSSTRQAIKGPAVEQAKTLYIYPEQYEGQEADPLIFCTGPVPAQQVEPFIPWLMRETGAKTFYLPSADYIWPHAMNEKVRQAAAANGGSIVGEEYFPVDHTDYRQTVERIMSSGVDVVFNTTVPPGVVPFLEQLAAAGFQKRGGRLVCTYFEENLVGALPQALVEGAYGCLDYYQTVADRFSTALLDRYNARFPGASKFSAGSASTGMYRGLKLWEAAVREAGSFDQDAVIKALDHAQLAEGPGGAAAMLPGQHHLRLNMYIAQVRNGALEVVKNLGPIDPKEQMIRAVGA